MKNFNNWVASLFLLTLSIFAMGSQHVHAAGVNIPPSAELTYSVTASYNGLSLNGTSFIHWKASKSSYSINNEAKVSFFGRILDAESSGKLTSQGLVPEKYLEKRAKGAKTTTIFDHANNMITFREDKTAPMTQTVQDKSSIIWQIASQARANPKRLSAGATLHFQVAGRSKVETWVFHVIKTETLATPAGQLKTVQLSRTDKKGQSTHVWLAIDHEWYPVQITFVEGESLQIHQTIQKISRL